MLNSQHAQRKSVIKHDKAIKSSQVGEEKVSKTDKEQEPNYLLNNL